METDGHINRIAAERIGMELDVIANEVTVEVAPALSRNIEPATLAHGISFTWTLECTDRYWQYPWKIDCPNDPNMTPNMKLSQATWRDAGEGILGSDSKLER